MLRQREASRAPLLLMNVGAAGLVLVSAFGGYFLLPRLP